MNGDEMLEFYARAYNTIQEICWTDENENFVGDGWECSLLWERLNKIDKYVFETWPFTETQKEQFTERTDHIRDRIYFNC